MVVEVYDISQVRVAEVARIYRCVHSENVVIIECTDGFYSAGSGEEGFGDMI